MEEKKVQASEIRLINFSRYFRPTPVEKMNDDWVLNGPNNNFYDYLIKRYNGSSTNSAILNSYVDLTYGQGLINTNRNVEDWLKFRKMITDEEVLKIVTDYTIFGEGIMQIIKANNSNKIPTVYHLSKELTAPQKVNEDGEIEGYWYSEDWSKCQREEYTPEFMPILKDGKSTDCYPIKPYKVGAKYFSDPEYLAGLPYAVMEEEMSNYYVSHIRNGLSFGYIINIPDGNSYSEEEKELIERQIKSKLTGSSNAGKFIINFNGRDAEITVTAIEMNDAHSQWEYLTQEARQQLLTAHRVTSPMLFGIKDNTGFGNNAEEMDTAEAQLMKRVISPRQRYLLDAFQSVAEHFGLKLALKFKPLTESASVGESIAEKQTDVQFSDEEPTELDKILEMYAQDEPIGYILDRIEYDLDSILDRTESDLSMSSIQNSEQDTKLWKVRYAYSVGTSKTPIGSSRNFCNKMMSLSKQGKVYRKEDIEAMSRAGVNGEFAHSGGKYDIFLYGGGVNCYHRWERRIYKKKRDEDDKPLGGNAMQNTFPVNVSEARRQGFKPEKNSPDVAIPEINKANKGAYPS